MAQKNIGTILFEAGVITQEQLQQCTISENQTDDQIQQCLLQSGSVTAEKIAEVLAKYTNTAYIEKISKNEVDVAVLAKVPLRFLRENKIIPIKVNGSLSLVTINPLLFQPIDELSMLLDGDITVGVSTEKVILDTINRYYPLGGTEEMIEELEEEKDVEEVDFSAIEDQDILSVASEAPIIKLVNHILFQAIKREASDIHIEPFEKEVSVRYRIDGAMYSIMTPPKRVQSALSSRIKIMAGLNIAEKRVPQDGRIEIKIADKAIDIRVSVLPVVFGERIVMRLLDKTRTTVDLQNFDMSERDSKVLLQAIAQPNGIIYVTGPTGSGKTTTLYSILSKLNEPDVNIITVEDPVEYQMAGIGQVQVKEKINMTFAAALRSILRQDPDIVMIGETRDQETAQIAIQAALTGHLVLSTLHTNSAPATMTRLIDMGIEPFLISSSIVLVCAQRLVRKLCSACKKSYQPPSELLASIGLSESDIQGHQLFQPGGCDTCNETGFKGRLAIFELMQMSNGLVKLVIDRADTSLLKKQAQQDGMTTLLDDGIRKIKKGLTTIEEVLSVATVELEDVE